MEKIIKLLEEFLNTLNQYELLNVIFLILAVLSIIISIILFLKSKKEKNPNYIISTHNIFKKSKTLKDLTIDYKGNKVEHLSITYISFWNKGKLTIHNNDCVKKDPLRVEFPKETQILGTDIIFEKNEINDFTTKINVKENSIRFGFDYLDKNQGLRFKVYHTGLKDKKVAVKGTIKGVKELTNCIMSSEYYADIFFEKTIGYPKKWLNGIVWKIYFILTLPISLIIFITGAVFASFRNILFRVPSEFIPEKDTLN